MGICIQSIGIVQTAELLSRSTRTAQRFKNVKGVLSMVTFKTCPICGRPIHPELYGCNGEYTAETDCPCGLSFFVIVSKENWEQEFADVWNNRIDPSIDEWK